MTQDLPGLAELPQAAALSLANAPHHCTEACRSYHAVWGFLRLFGGLPSVTLDHAVLMESLGQAIAAGARRVLVSGSADHGLTAYVIAAFQAAGVQPEITVTDMCETPLLTAEAFARAQGVPISWRAGDILAFEDAPFDVILAHNFLNFFPPEARRQLAARWFDLLPPGGRVLSVSTIKLGAKPVSRRFEPADALALADSMEAARAASPHADLIAPAALRALVLDYAERRRSNNIAEVEAITAPFEAAGFEVSLLRSGPAEDTTPSTHRLKSRTLMTARRPG